MYELSEQEIITSDHSDKLGITYETTPLARVFGANSNSALASAIRLTNPRAYQRMKEAWARQCNDPLPPKKRWEPPPEPPEQTWD